MLNTLYGATLGAISTAYLQIQAPTTNSSTITGIVSGVFVNNTVSMISDPVEQAVQNAYTSVASVLSTTGAYVSTATYTAAAGTLYLGVCDQIITSNTPSAIALKVLLSVGTVYTVKETCITPVTNKVTDTVYSGVCTVSDIGKYSIWVAKFLLTHKLNTLISEQNPTIQSVALLSIAAISMAPTAIPIAQKVTSYIYSKPTTPIQEAIPIKTLDPQ